MNYTVYFCFIFFVGNVAFIVKTNKKKILNRVLPIIVASQFFCTSLWFAGNAVMADIIVTLQLDQGFLAHRTSAVQFGFITGTLIFAVFTISDRFSPSFVFFVSAVVAALFNLAISFDGINSTSLLSFRFFTGFFLAGIYPVGMKIASDYFQKGLGKSLGLLVGALVLGTAFPHLLKTVTAALPWKYVVYSTSLLAGIGGSAMLIFVPDGPYRRAGQQLKITTFFVAFKDRKFRSASFGYFGHMWELYSFWAFVPVMLTAYKIRYPESALNVPLLSFLIISSGGLACVVSGLLSQMFSPKRLATLALFLSCLCCVASPLFLFSNVEYVFLLFLFFWGLVVIADSPLFSTLVAQNAPEESRGTSLTIVNCIGFSITIMSIQLIHTLSTSLHAQYSYLLLAIGPMVGLAALLKKDTP